MLFAMGTAEAFVYFQTEGNYSPIQTNGGFTLKTKKKNVSRPHYAGGICKSNNQVIQVISTLYTRKLGREVT